MPSRADWKEIAKGYRANIVVWIDQSSDNRLLEENRGGVCRTVTKRWVDAYMDSRPARAKFVNSFRDHGIPEEYIEEQEQYALDIKVHNSLLIGAKTLQAVSKDKVFLSSSVQMLKQSQSELHPGEVIKFPKGSAIQPILQKIARPTGYTMLSFRPRDSDVGHVVGFEVRPDLQGQMSANFPNGLFEFIDANLGLFVFNSARTMVEFFYLEVWKRHYAKAYAGCSFAVEYFQVEAGTGLGEVSKSGVDDDELLDEELLKELAQLEND
jgi:hypothetical protein